VVALGLSKGGFAGVGQMATPMLALVMPPLEAAVIMLPIMLVQDATALWVYRKDWNGRILVIVIPGAVLGIGAAWALAAHISDAAVRVFIGVTTIAFVLYSWMGAARIAREVASPAMARGVFWGTFWGALSGFTSTLCQAGAPPYQIYVLSQKLSKMTFVGTTAIFFLHHRLGHLAGAAAARHRHQYARLLGGAHHAAGDFLQDHHGADVPDLDRAAALRHDGFAAGLKFSLSSRPSQELGRDDSRRNDKPAIGS
jgi:hypothetical protein